MTYFYHLRWLMQSEAVIRPPSKLDGLNNQARSTNAACNPGRVNTFLRTEYGGLVWSNITNSVVPLRTEYGVREYSHSYARRRERRFSSSGLPPGLHCLKQRAASVEKHARNSKPPGKPRRTQGDNRRLDGERGEGPLLRLE